MRPLATSPAPDTQVLESLCATLSCSLGIEAHGQLAGHDLSGLTQHFTAYSAPCRAPPRAEVASKATYQVWVVVAISCSPQLPRGRGQAATSGQEMATQAFGHEEIWAGE